MWSFLDYYKEQSIIFYGYTDYFYVIYFFYILACIKSVFCL